MCMLRCSPPPHTRPPFPHPTWSLLLPPCLPATHQFSVAELRAIVEEAQAAGTYVAAHAYMPDAMQRALVAGVRSIEHGNWLDEETAKMMAERVGRPGVCVCVEGGGEARGWGREVGRAGAMPSGSSLLRFCIVRSSTAT